MSKTETRLMSRLKSVELMDAYRSLLDKASSELSKIELELVIGMIRYQVKYPEKAPWVRLEITFNPSIKPTAKKDELFEKTSRSAEIRHGNIFVIDPFITLQNLEELASDKDIEYISGEIIPT